MDETFDALRVVEDESETRIRTIRRSGAEAEVDLRNQRGWYNYDPHREWQYPDLHPDPDSRLPELFDPNAYMRGSRGQPRVLTLNERRLRNS